MTGKKCRCYHAVTTVFADDANLSLQGAYRLQPLDLLVFRVENESKRLVFGEHHDSVLHLAVGARADAENSQKLSMQPRYVQTNVCQLTHMYVKTGQDSAILLVRTLHPNFLLNVQESRRIFSDILGEVC